MKPTSSDPPPQEAAVVFRGNREEIEAAEAGRAYSAPPPEVDPYCLGERLDLMGREFFEAIARRQGVAYLNLTPALCAKVRKAGGPHAWIHDGHCNELGHEPLRSRDTALALVASLSHRR